MPTRSCVRPDCGEAATATLVYDYAARVVWLGEPGDERDEPGTWGVCSTHADNLKVPVGWTLDDRRIPRLSLRSVAS